MIAENSDDHKMPNFAFTTLIILLLAFPGYIFLSSYYSGLFTRQVLPRNWTDDIVKAIFFSLPIHIGILFLVFEPLQHKGIFNYSLRFEHVFRLLTTQFGPDESIPTFVNTLYENTGYIAGYYIGVLALALFAGHLLRFFVWSHELDVKFPWLFGYKSDALYQFMGRGKLPGVPQNKILVWLDAVTKIPTEIPGKNLMYRGVVAAYTTHQDGTPKEIILSRARRGIFENTQEGKTFNWKPIPPGAYFIIKYHEISTLNFTYLHAEDLKQETPQ